jgi:hypothetical protein
MIGRTIAARSPLSAPRTSLPSSPHADPQHSKAEVGAYAQEDRTRSPRHLKA